MAKKPKLPSLTSPKCVFLYTRVLGESDTKFNPDGQWIVKALFDPADEKHAAFLKKLDGATDAAVEAMKQQESKKKMKRVSAYKPQLDKEENETGKVVITFTMPHHVTAKKGPNTGKTYEFRPAVFDSLGQPITTNPRIAAGTQGRISFEYEPYYVAKDVEAGLRRRLQAVQIITLVEWDGKSASQFGFEEEEDGSFESKTAATDTETADDSADETGSDF